MKQSDRLKLQILSGQATEAQMAEIGYDAVFEIKTSRDSFLLRDFSDFEVKEISDRRFAFSFSNEKPDQGGDILQAKGWDLKVFRSNSALLWGHDGHTRPPIGTVPKISKDADVAGARGLAGEVEFASEGIDPFIDVVAALTKDRVVKASSIGCMILKTKKVEDQEERDALGLGPFGIFSEKHRLFEISLVSIGMNSDALARSCDELLSKERATKVGVESFLKSQPMTEMDYAKVIADLCGKFQVQIPFDMKAAETETASTEVPITAKELLTAYERLLETFEKVLDQNEKLIDQNEKLLALVSRSDDTLVVEDTTDVEGDLTDKEIAQAFAAACE